jgi:hypothetical protein
MEMRALGGGEGGVIDLNQIRLEGQALNFDQAIESWASRAGGKYVSSLSGTMGKSNEQTHLSPVNMDLPPQDIGYSPQSDIDAFIGNLRAAVMRRVESIPTQSSRYVDSLQFKARS